MASAPSARTTSVGVAVAGAVIQSTARTGVSAKLASAKLERMGECIFSRLSGWLVPTNPQKNPATTAIKSAGVICHSTNDRKDISSRVCQQISRGMGLAAGQESGQCKPPRGNKLGVCRSEGGGSRISSRVGGVAENPAPGWLHQRSILGLATLPRVMPQLAAPRVQAAAQGGIAPVSFPSHYS